MLGGEVEEPQDARAGVGFDIGGGCRERDREGGGDGVVAVTEVLVEDLPADPGATDDVAGAPTRAGERGVPSVERRYRYTDVVRAQVALNMLRCGVGLSMVTACVSDVAGYTLMNFT